MSRFVSRLHAMKPRETNRNASGASEPALPSATKTPTYEKVIDGRKQPVRGLWRREGTFYARFSATDQADRKRDVFRALPDCHTVPAAKEALRKLQDEAAVRAIPVAGRCPTFAEFGTRYLTEVSPTKRPATQKKEQTHIRWWTERVGALTLRQIHRTHFHTAIADLTKAELSPRTTNLYLITFRSVLKRAVEEGLIHDLPTHGLRPQKVSNRKRELDPSPDLHGGHGSRHGRHQERFAVRRLLLAPLVQRCPGEGGLAGAMGGRGLRERSGGHRRRRTGEESRGATGGPESGLGIPSPRHVRPASTRLPVAVPLTPAWRAGHPGENLPLACAAAPVELFRFHDARHYFISTCVMAGIDFMSIAA